MDEIFHVSSTKLASERILAGGTKLADKTVNVKEENYYGQVHGQEDQEFEQGQDVRKIIEQKQMKKESKVSQDDYEKQDAQDVVCEPGDQDEECQDVKEEYCNDILRQNISKSKS